MGYATPADLITALVEARDRGDVETVVRCYEPTATIVPTPDSVQSGAPALRAWLASFAALQPRFTVEGRHIVEGLDLALHVSAWTMRGVDERGEPFEITGRSTDVFRTQVDGSWLVALDNPWGTALL